MHTLHLVFKDTLRLLLCAGERSRTQLSPSPSHLICYVTLQLLFCNGLTRSTECTSADSVGPQAAPLNVGFTTDVRQGCVDDVLNKRIVKLFVAARVISSHAVFNRADTRSKDFFCLIQIRLVCAQVFTRHVQRVYLCVSEANNIRSSDPAFHGKDRFTVLVESG